MKSVGQAKNGLPSSFVERIYQDFPPHDADKIMQAMATKRKVSLRVNTVKSDIREIMTTLTQEKIKYQRVLWYPDGLLIENKRERDLEALSLYKTGQIYLQSLSSMLPPLLLAPKPKERVLDLCAAPGSKTTQLSAMMQNKGSIMAVELDLLRYERLLYNLTLQGATNVETKHTPGEKIGKSDPNSFDRVLLDAPCSGEGLFCMEYPGSYRFWQEKLVNQCASLQRRLLASAIAALKPRGRLVYSTCTLSVKENEKNVQWTLENYKAMKLCSVKIDKLPVYPALESFPEKNQSLDLTPCIRVLPSPTMEGFFCAVFTKEKGD